MGHSLKLLTHIFSNNISCTHFLFFVVSDQLSAFNLCSSHYPIFQRGHSFLFGDKRLEHIETLTWLVGKNPYYNAGKGSRLILRISMKAITLQLSLEIHYDCSFNLALEILSQHFSNITVENIKIPSALYINMKI